MMSLPMRFPGGPDWLDKQLWDITAKAEGFEGEIPLEPLRPMLRELIRDRFQLRLRPGKQNLPYLALVLDKKRPGLKPNTSGVEDFPSVARTGTKLDEGNHAVLCFVAGAVDTGEPGSVGRNWIAGRI